MSPSYKIVDRDYDLINLLADRSIGTRFQPIISMREQEVIGFEALSYGLDPNTGRRIPPNILFEQAEKAELTLYLDRLCREKAAQEFQKMSAGTPKKLLWLNFETSILDHIEVGTSKILETIARAGLMPCNVVIEIVESKVNNPDALQRFVDFYKGHGFFIALDDVGSGSSNLERIAMIKPDIIKIDRFLIRNAESEHYKYEVVKSLKNLAEGIGALILAEGLETEQEVMAMLDLDVTLQQGFFYSHPDQPVNEQLESCTRKIDDIAAGFRNRRVRNFSSRQAFFSILSKSVKSVSDKLALEHSSSFETILYAALNQNNSMECLYILNEYGIQISDTVCNRDRLMRPDSPLFRPASRGTDLSLKDYYLLVKAGLPRYVSAPYISRASGNLCVTISQPFTTISGAYYILCADHDCSEACA